MSDPNQNPFDANDKIEAHISDKLQEAGVDAQGMTFSRQGPMRVVTIIGILTDPAQTLAAAEGRMEEEDAFAEITKALEDERVQEKLKAEREATAKAKAELDALIANPDALLDQLGVEDDPEEDALGDEDDEPAEGQGIVVETLTPEEYLRMMERGDDNDGL